MANSNNTILMTKTLDPEVLKFGKHRDKNCTVYYPVGQDDYEKLRVQTPKLKICFDPVDRKDRNGSVFVTSLSHSMDLIGSDNNKESIELFEKKMRRVERVVQKILPPEVKNDRELSSSFWKKENSEYAATIRSSVKYDKGEPQIRIFKGKEREPVELSEFKRGTITSCILCLDQVWVTGNKYGINWVIEQAVIYPDKSSKGSGSRMSGNMFVDDDE